MNTSRLLNSMDPDNAKQLGYCCRQSLSAKQIVDALKG